MDYITIYAVDFWALSKATTSSDEDDYHSDLIEIMQDDEENYLRLDSDRIGENIVIELFKMADEFADIQDKIENSIKKDYYSYGRLNDVKQTYKKNKQI